MPLTQAAKTKANDAGAAPIGLSQSAPVKARRAPPQRLSSVASAVRLMKMFSEGEAEIGVTSLARRLGVAKSTVYRLASTLVAEGMLEQNR